MGLLAHTGAAPCRRRAEPAWPAAERSREHKRARVSGHVLLVALVGCVVVSMITFNGGSNGKHAARVLKQAVQQHATDAVPHAQEGAGSDVVAGKRHRKLEHGVQLEEGQLTLAAAVEIDIPLTQDAGAALAAATAAAAAAASDGGSVDGAADAGAAGEPGELDSNPAELPAAGQEGAEGSSGGAEGRSSADLPLDEDDAEDLAEMQLQDELARREQAERAADEAWEATGSGQRGADDGMENPEQPAGGPPSTASGADETGADAGGALAPAAAVQQAEAAEVHLQPEEAEQQQQQQEQQEQEQQQQHEQQQQEQEQQQQQQQTETQQQQQQQQQQQKQQSGSALPALAAADGAAGGAANGTAAGDGGGHGAGPAAAAAKPRRKKSPYQQALEKCESLACLREAALTRERHPGQFRFPHFFIIGWQKCATTSLFHHLVLHPSVQCPSEKEPEFFTDDCQHDPLNCPLDKQRDYIQQTLHINRVLRHNAYRAMFEGSTHYGREGPRIAQGLREVFPWVKLIASMREPISRGISMLAHNLDKSSIGCLTRRDVFSCLQRDLPALNYTTPLSAWLEAFPREQIMLLQYENLTNPEHTAAHLQAVKTFLELDPAYPASDLEHSNSREDRLGKPPEGWPMTRQQYQKLVQLVRPDAERVAALVTEYGLGDGKRWMANWEKAWQANFNSCNLNDECVIHLS
ncbi:hypothetical protein ABPG77_004419 [Micractinium sp. CCAP 211/92]